jgi:hypothetical protein
MSRTVLVTEPTGRMVLSRVRPVDRALALSRGWALDHELAAGNPPSGRRLRAIRAGMLVAPTARRKLAECWLRLLDGDERRPDYFPKVRWAQVDRAHSEIHELADALRAARPVPARGVAAARLLLTDGRGPLFQSRTGSGSADLASRVRQAVRELDPYATPFAGS